MPHADRPQLRDQGALGCWSRQYISGWQVANDGVSLPSLSLSEQVSIPLANQNELNMASMVAADLVAHPLVVGASVVMASAGPC